MTQVRQVVRLVQEGSLYVLLFLLPFSNAAIEIAWGFLFVGWLVARCDPATATDSAWSNRELRLITLGMGGYLAVCALSIVVSDYPSLSVQGFVTKWVEYLTFCMMAADLGKCPHVVTRGLTALAWSSLLVVIEGLTQELTGKGLLRGYPLVVYGRMTGPYKNPIDLATYLMVVIPILIVLARHVSHAARRWLWCLVALVTACLLRTEAQGPLLGFVIGLGVLCWAAPKLRRDLAIFMAVAGGLGLTWLSLSGGLARITMFVDTGTVDRWFMWQAAVGMIRDRPLLGHGLNTFMANYLDYWVGGERQPRYAHNCYLQVAAETGMIGALLFVALLVLMFKRLVAGLPGRGTAGQTLLPGLMSGLFAFAVQAALDTNFYSLRQAALFWVLAGLALGLSVSEPKRLPIPQDLR